MLFSTDEIQQRRAEISRQHQAGEITDVVAGRLLIEADPDCAAGYLLLSNWRIDEGDPEGAESYCWEALQRMPCDARPYLSLAEMRRRQSEHDPVARRLTALGFYKISFREEVPQEIQDLFRQNKPDAEMDFGDPNVFQDLAMAIDQQARNEEAPDERLEPYELLNEIEIWARPGLEPELLGRILDHSSALIPLWRAALRQWAERGDAPGDEALGMIIALLGEAGGPGTIGDLMELVDSTDPLVFLHANWAVWRLGQRFPAEALATLAAADRVTPRCAAAEHIPLLPDTPGREAALSRLLEGFEELAKEDEVAFLLAAVTGALERLSRFADAERALRQYRTLLRKDDRRWLQDELDAGFVGRLEDAGIEGLTIEEICSDRALMDEEDEDEDEEEEDGEFEEDGEDEFDYIPEPVIAPVRPGRNAPCWCGSGKKYKKCHLSADEDAERSGEQAEPLHERMRRQLLEGMNKWHSRSDFKEATSLYFGLHPEKVDAEFEGDRMGWFFEWCFHDFRPRSTGKTLIEECLRRRAGSLSAEERELLEAWREARFGIWEVQSVRKGEGVELKDWFEGDRFFVHDVSSSRSMMQWDCVLSRIYRSEGSWYFAGNGYGVPRNLVGRLTEQVERESRESGQSAAAFVRANSHRWHSVVDELCRRQLDDLRVVNAEGDDLEPSTAEYRVEDEAAVAAALSRAKQFEAPKDNAPGEHSFAWLEKAEGPRRSYGNIEIRGGRLRLECNSQKRLAIGRQLVEKHAGTWLRHERDTVQPQDALKQEAYESSIRNPEEKPSGLPPDEERELLLKLKTEYYARWVDEPVPALGGQTPREAARSQTGRRALEDLLRLMENSEARGGSKGQPVFDFSQVRKTLGM
jgi:hypothetical protein